VRRVGLVHGHTRHSFDSLLPVSAYLAFARRRGIEFLCITDHNTIAGSVEAFARNRDPGLEVVIGAEYATDHGDVIGLFLHEEIRERRWEQVVGAIHDQDGLVLLPHPVRHGRADDRTWRDADLVEVFNARSSQASNAAALHEATVRALPQVAGADVHTLWELVRGPTLTVLDGDGSLRDQLRQGPRTLLTRLSSRNLTRYSQSVKVVRRAIGMPGRR
jgi:predicted metal-dependent phosphoesterase TrpH